MKRTVKSAFAFLAAGLIALSAHPVMADGGGEAAIEVTVFAAKSLSAVMEDLTRAFETQHPDVKLIGSFDSSGTLMRQIEEGAHCDVFFSAAEKQMDELGEKGFLVGDTRRDVVNNQVCLVTYKDSGTEVTGLKDLAKAESMALADGSVPVGKYTRDALVAIGTLSDSGDSAKITAEEVSLALGGVEINSCANVGAVAAAVSEGSNEVGTVYYSDTYGYENRLEILEQVPSALTGDVIYPAAVINDAESGPAEREAAEAFVEFLVSEEAKDIFEARHFTVKDLEPKASYTS